MPSTQLISTTDDPIRSEFRAPYTVRLKRSRPKLSVPNRCTEFGRMNWISGRTRFGSNGVMTGAKAATARRTDRSAPPITMDRRRTTPAYQGRRGAPASAACNGFGGPSASAMGCSMRFDLMWPGMWTG